MAGSFREGEIFERDFLEFGRQQVHQFIVLAVDGLFLCDGLQLLPEVIFQNLEQKHGISAPDVKGSQRHLQSLYVVVFMREVVHVVAFCCQREKPNRQVSHDLPKFAVRLIQPPFFAGLESHDIRNVEVHVRQEGDREGVPGLSP